MSKIKYIKLKKKKKKKKRTLVKLAANIIESHICNIQNQSTSSPACLEQAKIANVWSVYKKAERKKLKITDSSHFCHLSQIYFRILFKSL